MGTIEERFRQRTPRSAEHAASSARVMPGGDTRAAGHHPPYQLTMVSGEGAHLTDLDGNRYLDLIGNFTSLVHGNAYPPIIEASMAAAAQGTNWPARNVHAVELAEELCNRAESVEQVRFTNSGSEATMLGVEIARAATGRRKLLMARYGYHGSAPWFECGTFGHEGPDTLLATFGGLADFERVLHEHGDEIACVILEPVLGSGGVVEPPDGFLAGVAAAARAAGSIVIFDEVITLRLAAGGAQAINGVTPDLTAMAKIIGGGYPVGAIGGRADLMELTNPFAPKVFHSGTFNGNPVTTAAGLVSIRHLTSDAITALDQHTVMIADGLHQAAARHGVPLSTRRSGSMLQIYLSDEAPANNVERTDGDLANQFHLASLNHGLFAAGRGLVALSTVFTDDQVAEVGDRFDAALAEVAVSL